MAHESKIKIIHWNICGLQRRAHHITAATVEGFDIFLLQETHMADTSFILSGYQTFLLPRVNGQNGLATPIKNTLPSTRIRDPPDCGEGNEVLGVRIKTRNKDVAIYKVYRNNLYPLQSASFLVQFNTNR